MVVVDSAKFGSVFARVWTQWRCKTRPNNASHDARLVLTLFIRTPIPLILPPRTSGPRSQS